MSLDDVSVGVFNQALENIAALRAQNGGSMSRLNFASDNITKQSANMEAAYGRIMDVDIAAESTRLAKYNACWFKVHCHALSSQLVFGRRADASALKNEYTYKQPGGRRPQL